MTTFVADNPDEIRKFVRYRKRAELLIRVSFRSPNAVVDLSRQFGCEPGAVLGLIELARRLGIRVRGLSFHVGSQATDPAKHVEAVRACTNIIGEALLAGLPSLDILDIGGGFPVHYTDAVMRYLLDGAGSLLGGQPRYPHLGLRPLLLALLQLENLLERRGHQTSFPSCSIVLA